MMTVAFIFLVSCCTLTSQLLLKKGVMELKTGASLLTFVISALSSPLVLLGILLQLVGFILWLYVLSRADLGYAFGFSGAFFYILLPLITWWLYGERLTPLQWGGMVMISLGVACITVKSF